MTDKIRIDRKNMEPVETDKSLPMHSPTPNSVNEKCCSWRLRLGAAMTDGLLLLTLSVAGNTLVKDMRAAAIISYSFFGFLWMATAGTYGSSVGKWLAGIEIRNRSGKVPNAAELCMRFAFSWLPLLLYPLIAAELSFTSSSDLPTEPTQAEIVVALVIYIVMPLANLLCWKITSGSRGFHDLISFTHCDCVANLRFVLLHRIALTFCALFTVVVIGWWLLLVIVSAQATALHNSVSVHESRPSVSMEMSPEEIREVYSSRTVEVYASWKERIGLIFTEEVSNGKGGSGLLFVNNATDGLIVTNLHVVAPSKSAIGKYCCSVRSDDGQDVSCQVVAIGKSPLDLAILRVELKDYAPGYIALRHRAYVKNGEKVVAIGNALSRGLAVTDGIVSLAADYSIIPNFPLIRSSAPLSHGNSGGPLFTCRDGRLVGINTLTFTEGQNFNLAFPADCLLDMENFDFLTDEPVVRTLLRQYGECAAN